MLRITTPDDAAAHRDDEQSTDAHSSESRLTSPRDSCPATADDPTRAQLLRGKDAFFAFSSEQAPNSFDSSRCSLDEARRQIARMETLVASLNKQVIDLKKERLSLRSSQPTASESSSTPDPPSSPESLSSTSARCSQALSRNGNFVHVPSRMLQEAQPPPVASLKEAANQMQGLSKRGLRLYQKVAQLKQDNRKLALRLVGPPVAKRRKERQLEQVLQRASPQQLGEILEEPVSSPASSSAGLHAHLSSAPGDSVPVTLPQRVTQPRVRGSACHRGQSGRTRIAPAQQERLLAYAALDPSPNGAERARIAAEVELPPRVVQVWFQNQRTRSKACTKEHHAAASQHAHLPPSPPLSPPLSPPEGVACESTQVSPARPPVARRTVLPPLVLLGTWIVFTTWAMWHSLRSAFHIVGIPLVGFVVGSVLFPDVPSKHALQYLNGLHFAHAATRLLSTSHVLWDPDTHALRVEASPGGHAALVVSTLGTVARAVLTAGSRGRLFWPTTRGLALLNGATLGALFIFQGTVSAPGLDEIPEEARIVQLPPETALTAAGMLVLLALGFGPATRSKITSFALYPYASLKCV